MKQIKTWLAKLEGGHTEKGLADRLATARLNHLSNPPTTKSELEAIAVRKPESMAARLARGRLRLLA